jgi:transketolase
MAQKTGVIVTVEEHSVIGGLGSAAAETLAGQAGFRFARIGIDDKFGKSGKPKDLFEEYGLTASNIAKTVKETV